MPDEIREDQTVKRQLGFIPTSVLYLRKSQSLQKSVNDKLGQDSYTRGTTSLSQFNPALAELIIKLWSNKDDIILDPFAGRCRAIVARNMDRKYIGYEISVKAYEHLLQTLKRNTLVQHKHQPKVINISSEQIEADCIADLVFSCPPYWNVEDYDKAYGEQIDGQLSSIPNYDAFLLIYKNIIGKCFNALKPGKYVVWVVADIRRNKTLIPFGADTIKIFQDVGFKVHDVIINKLDSLAIRGIAQCIKNNYLPKMHEYVLVFKKPGIDETEPRVIDFDDLSEIKNEAGLVKGDAWIAHNGLVKGDAWIAHYTPLKGRG